jgi:drug/metabolite transporter (DMT)-like permease
MLAVALGAACLAESAVFIKGFPRADPVTVNAVSMATGAVILSGASRLMGETPALPSLPATWAALLYLILLGSCAVFILYLFVLKRWTASATSYSFVLFPFVTVAAGAWLAGERISPVFLLGGALVLAGVYIGAIAGQGGRRQPSPAMAAEDAPTGAE